MNNSETLEQRVLDYVTHERYQPVKPRVIARKLGLDNDGLRDLKRAIKRLVKRGALAYGPKHLVLPGGSRDKQSRQPELVGRFSRAAAGFGFVTPRPPADAGPDDAVPDDIYIPRSRTRDATTGDLVRIAVGKQRKGKEVRTAGRVLEIVERRTRRFVGTYLERGEHGYVSVDGNQFDDDILTGDASARAARVGDKVVIEMVQFPGQQPSGGWREGEAVIVEVLGDRGKPGVDTMTVIAEFDLPGDFGEDVLDDARDQAAAFDETIGPDRTDFTNDVVVTIDPRTARDFDDAISLTRNERGHWVLGVHIADVSHFVQPNTALDNEAFRRGTSVYLPDRVIPMLPEVISNNLASLQPDRVRYTMSAIIEFTEDGAPVATELHRGAIRSRHRFNYEEIDDYLADPVPWKKKLEPEVFSIVADMHTLAMRLRQRRMDRGSFDLIIPDVEIDLDENGKVAGAHTRQHTESHQVIEEFMLAANEAVAQRLVDEGLYLMRRIHEPPSPVKLADLKTLLGDLGYHGADTQSRFGLKRIIEQARGSANGYAVHFAILRAMQKAIYSPREVGHYALASDAYCHFTSPIRRYPDLIIHRMVGALVDGKKPASDFGRLQQLGLHCSELEQRAEQAERELIKLKLINFLRERLGYEMEAVITGVEPFGLFAQGTELPASGLIPRESLPDDRYYYDRGTRTLAGHRPGNTFRLGNRIRVRVVSADPDRRETEFALVTDRSSASKTGKRQVRPESSGTPGRKGQRQGGKPSRRRSDADQGGERSFGKAKRKKSGNKKRSAGGSGSSKASSAKSNRKKPTSAKRKKRR